jgi:hypothetical protein
MLKITLFVILLPALAICGCSPRASKVGTQVSDSNGVKIELTAYPDPAIAGANTFYVHVTDDDTGQPVVNANVTISAYNELAGGGDRESGRSQGDGTYMVPIKLGIPDRYNLDVEVQRPGHDDSDTTFTVDAS